MKPEPARQTGPPALDEEAFDQLLSAAYVMQEHNARLKRAAASANGAKTNPETPAPRPAETKIQASPAVPEPAVSSARGGACRQCGHGFTGPELFCGICGTPRGNETTTSPQPKPWASLWDMHETAAKPSGAGSANIAWKPPVVTSADEDAIELFPAELEEIVAQFAASEAADKESIEAQEPEAESAAAPQPEEAVSEEDGKLALTHASRWASAAKAHDWFESLKAQQTTRQRVQYIWLRYRGAISIAAASLFLLFVVIDWGLQPSPRSPNGTRELSGFEQMLVSLGLAEVTPSSQGHRGNPDTQVWVDPHTALYYCPGAPLYGKTKDGRTTSQIEAQRDQFEPATRKACD